MKDEKWHAKRLRKLASRLLIALTDRSRTQQPALADTAAGVIAGHAFMVFKSLHILWEQRCTDGAHILLRTLMEVRLQLYWLLDDPNERDTRARRFFQWTRVEVARYWRLDCADGFADAFALEGKTYLERVRDLYGLPASTRSFQWDKWYGSPVRKLAQQLGKEQEVYPLYERLSGFVHGSPLSILRRQIFHQDLAGPTSREIDERDRRFVIREGMYLLADVIQEATVQLRLPMTGEVNQVVDDLQKLQATDDAPLQ